MYGGNEVVILFKDAKWFCLSRGTSARHPKSQTEEIDPKCNGAL